MIRLTEETKDSSEPIQDKHFKSEKQEMVIISESQTIASSSLTKRIEDE